MQQNDANALVEGFITGSHMSKENEETTLSAERQDKTAQLILTIWKSDTWQGVSPKSGYLVCTRGQQGVRLVCCLSCTK